MNITEQEKKVIDLMFENMENIINTCGGYIIINGEPFSGNDLYSLSEKLESENKK